MQRKIGSRKVNVVQQHAQCLIETLQPVKAGHVDLTPKQSQEMRIKVSTHCSLLAEALERNKKHLLAIKIGRAHHTQMGDQPGAWIGRVIALVEPLTQHKEAAAA
jgi:hypothetical protein